MTFDPYGFTDPLHQVHEARPSVSPAGITPGIPDSPASPPRPLGDLQGQMAQVFQGAAP
jgi:hypothetical protein